MRLSLVPSGVWFCGQSSTSTPEPTRALESMVTSVGVLAPLAVDVMVVDPRVVLGDCEGACPLGLLASAVPASCDLDCRDAQNCASEHCPLSLHLPPLATASSPYREQCRIRGKQLVLQLAASRRYSSVRATA